MTRLGWNLFFGCVFSWGVLSMWAPSMSPEIFLGMLGPLVLALTTLRLVGRTWVDDPAGLTAAMTAGFFLKMLFCGVYVALVVGVFAFRGAPFAASFTAHFLGLSGVLAFHLTRLLQAGGWEDDVD